MQDLLKKYQSLRTTYRVLIAILFFSLGIIILPNLLVYGLFIFASHKLIQKKSLRSLFVVVFSIAALLSFIFLFDEGDAEQQSSTTVETAQIDQSDDEISSDTATSTPRQISSTTQAEQIEQDLPTASAADTNSTTSLEDGVNEAVNDRFEVVGVVDGDTIKLSMNGTTETVRLIGIDTPETVHPSKPVECMGIEASEKAKQLLNGETIRFESDETQDTRDRYGRLLGHVFLPNGENYGEVMLRSGFATEYTYSTAYNYQSSFKLAEQTARAGKVGLWADGACEDEFTEDPVSEPQTDAEPASGSDRWYVSSHHTSKFYYCEDSDAWKELSETYIKIFDSEDALKAEYPNHTLHESCL